MDKSKSALVVLMETVEVRQVFPHWPDDMKLATCLLDSGECRMFIYRREESDSFPTRIRRYLDMPAEDICIFPARSGYPSRRLLYSDEQRLLALISDAPEMVEEAEDYSSNYSFALEEGLDPTTFLCRSGGGVQSKPRPKMAKAAVAKTDPKPVSKVSDRPKRERGLNEAALPAFLRKSDVVLPGAQFRSAIDIRAAEEPRSAYRLMAEQNGWFIIAHSGGRGVDVRVNDPGSIFLSDDRRVVAVRLSPTWSNVEPLPARVLLRATSLPQSLRKILAECVGEVLMKTDGNFLFLHLTATQPIAQPIQTAEPEPMDQAPEPAAEVAPKHKRWKRSNVRRQLVLLGWSASLLVLIGVGLQFGPPPQIHPDKPNALIDWNRYRIAGQPDQSG